MAYKFTAIITLKDPEQTIQQEIPVLEEIKPEQVPVVLDNICRQLSQTGVSFNNSNDGPLVVDHFPPTRIQHIRVVAEESRIVGISKPAIVADSTGAPKDLIVRG